MRIALAIVSVAFSLAAAYAETPAVPNVKPLSMDAAVIKALDGQTRHVTLYNPSMTATGTWSWKKKLIHIVSGADEFDRPWDAKKGKYCVKGEPCRTLYVDGSKIYEVNPDGKVHAISE